MIGLHVKCDYRRTGDGRQLFDEIVYARDTNGNHLDFHVTDWSPAKHFYSKLNAINLTEVKGYQLRRYQLNNAQIHEFSN